MRAIPPEIYNAISELVWVADGIYGRDGDPVQGLIDLGIESPSSAQTLLDMRWLTDGLADEEAWVISSLGYLALDVPDAIEDMVPLPWIADGITEDESWAISSLAYLALESTDAVRTIASREWFVDGITEDESLVIQSLGSISYETGTGSTFVTMPFLESIEPPGSHALMSLDILSYEAPEAFDDILSNPVIDDGVTDNEAPILVLLHDVHSENPSLVSTLLPPDSTRVEQRDIDLPLAGRVRLATVRTQDGAARNMDLLESAVRFSESYMGEPFPTNFVLLLFAETVMPGADAHNAGINMTVHPDYDVDDGREDALDAPFLLAHEVAHYYWGGSGEAWIDEGAADVMSFAYDESTTGYEWYVSDIATMYSCSIPDLSALERMPGEPPPDCIYGLGAGLFLDLYRTLGAEDFRKGFTALYLLSQNDPGEDGPGARRIHVRKAFEFHPAARDEVIPRWYGDRLVRLPPDSFSKSSSIAARLEWFGASCSTFSKSWIALPYLVIDLHPSSRWRLSTVTGQRWSERLVPRRRRPVQRPPRAARGQQVLGQARPLRRRRYRPPLRQPRSPCSPSLRVLAWPL